MTKDLAGQAKQIPVIGADELRAKICFEDMIDPMSSAFQESSAKLGENGLIAMFPHAERDLGDVYVKTGTLHGHSIYIVKVSPWFAENIKRKQPQGGFIAVFDSLTGHTLAILDEQHYLSDIRTAAAGALAARVFAPKIVATAAVLGAGVQAFWQVRALYHERAFENLLIWARDEKKAEMLRSRLTALLPEAEINVSKNLENTVRAADVLITSTSSQLPIVQGEWLHPGQHITAVGADDANKCELDASVLNRSHVFVDALDTANANGDVHRAISNGRYRLDQIRGEIGDVLAGRIPGRLSQDEITVAKLVGIGAQDLVAAETALLKINRAAAY